MWQAQPKQASSATMSIVYITVGALIDVWATIYYIYLARHTTASDTAYLWIYGFFASGLVLMAIGFALGRIGRAAKQAEVTAQPQVVNNAAPPANAPQPIFLTVPAAPAPPAPVASPAPVATHVPTSRVRS